MRLVYCGLSVVAVLIAGMVIYWSYATRALPLDTQAKFVGRQSCAECHQEQVNAFAGSHHDRAMEIASEQTVAADFDGKWREESGQRARFFRDKGQYFAEIPDGNEQTTTYRIQWTFGVEPLQQYMVSMVQPPDSTDAGSAGGLGRIQVLRWSWDTQRKAWFHLDPPDVHETLLPDDELAWRGPAQRWNSTCAACHSTDVVKKFDTTSLAYHTTFSEIDVSCEACHGPASIHLQIVRRPFYRKDPHFGHGLANIKSSTESQIQSCVSCHSRRDELVQGFVAGKPYADYFTENLLTELLYHDDGQIKDEVFEHGSFIQSKMYHKGIRCSDCHDPHTARLKHEGNALCTSCHQHPSFKYDTPAHHFHKTDSTGSQCVNCHMPHTTYMKVDPRRDHSIRIPRPDLSVQLGTPNACTGCHLKSEQMSESKRAKLTNYSDWIALSESDVEISTELKRVDQWCDDACNRWYGENRRRPYHFAVALHEARERPVSPKAVELLLELLHKRGEEAPAIARATALQELASIAPDVAVAEAIKAREDSSPLVRAAAAMAIATENNPGRRFELIKPMFNDLVRSVRVEAARTATTLLPETNPFHEPAASVALKEYQASLTLNNDRASGNLGLGVLSQQLGNNQEAIKYYEDAIAVEPLMVGPRTNYASLLDALAQGAKVNNPQIATQLEEKAKTLRKEELPLLQRDFSYAPDNAAIANRLGLAFYLDGNLGKAESYLKRASELEPYSADYALTYVLLLEKVGEIDQAVAEVKRVLIVSPEDSRFLEIQRRLSVSSSSSK